MSIKEKVIKGNQSILPFFGERMNFIRGLDPLGLQNTSDATFSLLLSGLNNVTGRIRYYSFYCWLLDQYSQRSGSTNPEHQRKFIRTAEYIIALSSQFYDGDNGSIPGSNYAKNEIQKEEKDIHDLNAGIAKQDGSTANTYWNYRWGAFGQYYIGSLRDIGIIIDRDLSGVYARTNSRQDEFVSGEMVSSAFDESISAEKKQLFFDCITKGEISETQLQSLLPEFNLTQVPENSQEQQLLTRLLIQKDFPLRIEEEPATLRKDSIFHLLGFVQSKPQEFSDREFVYSAYDSKGLKDDKREASLLGWYYYQFNEFWHYSNTSIFNGTLDYLEGNFGPKWVPLRKFVDEVTNQVIEKFIGEGLVQESSEPLTEVLEKLQPDEYYCIHNASSNTKIDKVFYGFLLMFSEYLNNLDELALLKEYGENNNLAKDGEGPGYFLLQFRAKLTMPFIDYIKEYIFKNIIYRHQYVAFRKIRGGALSTQKFIIEDQHIRYLGNFEPSYTGPRIGNLIAFMKDLSVIAADNSLTEYGEQVLNQITFTND
jgi:hypothetical protein